jgi:hypothetical protein
MYTQYSLLVLVMTSCTFEVVRVWCNSTTRDTHAIATHYHIAHRSNVTIHCEHEQFQTNNWWQNFIQCACSDEGILWLKATTCTTMTMRCSTADSTNATNYSESTYAARTDHQRLVWYVCFPSMIQLYKLMLIWLLVLHRHQAECSVCKVAVVAENATDN